MVRVVGAARVASALSSLDFPLSLPVTTAHAHPASPCVPCPRVLLLCVSAYACVHMPVCTCTCAHALDGMADIKLGPAFTLGTELPERYSGVDVLDPKFTYTYRSLLCNERHMEAARNKSAQERLLTLSSLFTYGYGERLRHLLNFVSRGGGGGMAILPNEGHGRGGVGRARLACWAVCSGFCGGVGWPVGRWLPPPPPGHSFMHAVLVGCV